MARKYKLTNDMFVMCENDKDCVFCDRCTDIFWDFSNGIYGIVCELNKKPEKGGNCTAFIEEQPDDKK